MKQEHIIKLIVEAENEMDFLSYLNSVYAEDEECTILSSEYIKYKVLE